MNRRALVPLVLFLACGTAFADTVVLKNGRRVEGRLIQDTEREVTIETDDGVLVRFERRQVASVEKASKPGTALKAEPPEELGVPDGATEDEVARLRALVPQLRDTARRFLDVKKEREAAEKTGSKDLDYLVEREKQFARQLDGLKSAREAIDHGAAERFAKAKALARAEAQQLRGETDALRASSDAAGLAERAQKLRARAPESARDPRRAAFLGEALHAMEESAAVEEAAAKDAKTTDAKVAALSRAAAHLAWCADNDPEGPDRCFKRAVAALTEAHRARGLDAREVERALEGLQAYKACATLIEDRLGERRWGPELGPDEFGQYRVDWKDRCDYVNEPPTNANAKAARERRDRTESRARKDDTGATRTMLVKVTRWYDLMWDAKRKRWARETVATELESKKLVPLLCDAQDRADAVHRAKKDLAAAAATAEARRDVVRKTRRKVECAEATEADLDEAVKAATEQSRAVGAAQDAVAKAQSALGDKQAELVTLEKEIERARRGE